jgi:hypothetical protein
MASAPADAEDIGGGKMIFTQLTTAADWSRNRGSENYCYLAVRNGICTTKFLSKLHSLRGSCLNFSAAFDAMSLQLVCLAILCTMCRQTAAVGDVAGEYMYIGLCRAPAAVPLCVCSQSTGAS